MKKNVISEEITKNLKEKFNLQFDAESEKILILDFARFSKKGLRILRDQLAKATKKNNNKKNNEVS